MNADALLHWVLPAIFLLVCGLLLVVTNDPAQEKSWETKALAFLYPGMTVYRHRAFRYVGAAVMFAVAVTVFIRSS